MLPSKVKSLVRTKTDIKLQPNINILKQKLVRTIKLWPNEHSFPHAIIANIEQLHAHASVIKLLLDF